MIIKKSMPEDVWTNAPKRLYNKERNKSMMLSCAISTKDRQYVAVTDIPGAFLHADMDGNIHMLLEGIIFELIV